MQERLAHAREARQRLGTSIPWLVDPIDNRLKHALGDRPNSEFVLDPKGVIVRKRAWSSPATLRKDLEELVGPVEKVTKATDLNLKKEPAPKVAARGVVPRVSRPRMQPLVVEPQADKKGAPFYAKLRAEGDSDLLAAGKGKLYLGFHLDPIHRAHWNNRAEPLRFRLEAPEGVTVARGSGEGPKVKVESDADPREFLIDVGAWPADRPLRLTVSYFACTEDGRCLALQQDYTLHRKRDRDGGSARAGGVGGRPGRPDETVKRLLAHDKNGDGKLSKEEAPDFLRPRFDRLDANKDGHLDKEEIEKMAGRSGGPGRPSRPGGAGRPRRPGR